MVPLGIITAITSAIRVQGMQVAKAFIGRARENRALAEIELMSSTSGEVCELFNGNSIVRAMGKPRIAQFIIFPKEYDRLERECNNFDQLPKEPSRRPETGPDTESDTESDKESTADSDTDSELKSESQRKLQRKPEHKSEPESISEPSDKSCGIHSLRTASKYEQPRLMKCQVYQSESSAFFRGYLMTTWQYAQVSARKASSPWIKLFRIDSNDTNDEENAKPTSQLEVAPASQQYSELHLPPGAEQALEGPPNLQLNLSSDHFDTSRIKKRHEIIMAAIIAVCLQTSLIAIAAATVFLIGPDSSSLLEFRAYGFPCYVAGSVLLSIGTGLCSFIVEHSTIEFSWEPLSADLVKNNDDAPRLVWLQQKQIVNDQAFNGYVISAGPKRRVVTSSRNDNMNDCLSTGSSSLEGSHPIYKNKIDTRKCHATKSNIFWQWLTVGAALLAALGFATQFMGLRGLAFPCSIAQLGAIFVMALVRAGIRRRLGRIPDYSPAFSGYEIDFLAEKIASDRNFRRFHQFQDQPEVRSVKQWQKGSFRWMVTTPERQENTRFLPEIEMQKPPSLLNSHEPPSVNIAASVKATDIPEPVTSQQLLRVRERLGDLTQWTSRSSASALSLTQSIESVMDTFFPASSKRRPKSVNWLLKATTLVSAEGAVVQDAFPIRVTCEGADGGWKVDLGKIDAVLSLWMAHIDAENSELSVDTISHKEDQLNPQKPKSTADPADPSLQARPDWRRAKAGDSLIYSFYRIIGDKSENGVLKRDISWWIDSLVAEQSEVEKKRDDADLVIGFNDSRQAGTMNELAIISKASLPIILAHHLFTSFMWTVAEFLPKDCLNPKGNGVHREVEIEGSHIFNSSDFDQSWLRLRLRHRDLTRLVRQIESYGLGSMNDILLCMIPALSSKKLLPNQAIRKLIPRVSPGHGWVETAACHNKLLQAIKAGDIDGEDKLNIAIITATIDFLYLAFEPYDEQQMKPPSDLQRELEALVRELTSSQFTIVMQKLAPFYIHQSRQKIFEKIFRQFGDQRDESGRLETTENDEKLDTRFAVNALGFTRYHCVVFSRDRADYEVFSYFRRHLENYEKSRKAWSDNPTLTADLFGWTPWHYICLVRPAATRFLLEDFEDLADQLPKRLDTLGRSPIHVAALEELDKNLNTMFSALSDETKRMTIQTGSHDGMTPLHLSCRNGSLAFLDLIRDEYETRDFLHMKDFWGRQALHIATRFGHDRIAIQLLELGSHPDQPDDIGKSPIDYFSDRRKRKQSENAIYDSNANDHFSYEKDSDTSFMDEKDSEMFLKFLMKNPSHRYSHGKTFLLIAIELVDESILYTLLSRRFDIEAQDDDGRTPLHYAILAGRASMATALIEGINIHGKRVCANLSVKDSRNTTALMFAAQGNLKSVVQSLWDTLDEPFVDETNDDGKTAIHQASRLEMVEFLVNKGCDPWVRASDGRTMLHTAIDEKKKDIAFYLLGLDLPRQVQENPFDINHESLLVTACKNGFSTVIQQLVEKWPTILNLPDRQLDQTPLCWACEQEHEQAVEELIQHGADVNKPATEWRNFTPLHFAVRAKTSALVDIILRDPNARLNQESDDGDTPLQLAVRYDCSDIARKLALDNRTPFDQRIQFVKDFMSVPKSSFYRVTLDVLQSVKDEALVCEFLFWLVRPLRRARDRLANLDILALVAPLARDLEGGMWEKIQDSYDLVSLLSETQFRDTLIGQFVNSQGVDQDKWCYVDYINRFDRSGALTRAFSSVQPFGVNESGKYEVPTSLDWIDYKESLWAIPCNGHNSDSCSKVHEVTVYKKSSFDIIALLCSNHSIAPSEKHFYFEIEVLKDSESKAIGIGFCGRPNSRDIMPGWFSNSWGYHGDDGRLFVELDAGELPSPDFGDSGKFSRGDTVGACLNMHTGQGFCTLNGKKLDMGNAFKQADRFRFGKFYPCVGFEVTEEGVGLRFKVNFDGSHMHPFKYKGPFEFN